MADFYGVVTVSDKGQIAIPIDVRRELDIKNRGSAYRYQKKGQRRSYTVENREDGYTHRKGQG